MKQVNRLRLVLGILVTIIGASATQAQSNFNGPIESREIAKGIYLLSAGSNAILVLGRKDAVVVDTLIAAQSAPLVKKVGELAKLPVSTVINTHFHSDHTGANEAFHKLGAAVIATADAARTMARATPNARGAMNPAVPEGGRPTITFDGSKTLKAANHTFKVTEMPAAHTDGDAVVQIAGANIIIVGDLHHSNEYPVYDTDAGCQCGSYAGNLEADRLIVKLANDKTIIIPGHGGPTNKAEMLAYIMMLEKVRDDVQAKIKAGKSVDQVVASKPLANDKSVQPGGPDNRDTFVRQLYFALKTGRGA